MQNMDEMFFDELRMIEQMTNSTNLYDASNKLFLSLMIYFSGFVFSAWIVGRYLLIPLPKKEKIIQKKLYTDKYCLADMERDLSCNNEVTKNTSVLESTPQGIVIMRYNNEREGFEYWCDNKNIKYDYLETVARKFVIMNFCTNLYVDRRENIKKQQDEIDDMIKKQKKDKEKKEKDKIKEKSTEKKALKKKNQEVDSVFVKSKFSIEKKIEKKTYDKSKIVAKKANKYLFMGKTKEFQWLKQEKKQAPAQEISFSSFKSLFMKGKED